MVATKKIGVYTRVKRNGDISYIITYRLNGKFIKSTLGTNKNGWTISRAQKERNIRLASTTNKFSPLLSKITFKEAFDEYTKSISHKPDTRNSQGRFDNHIKGLLGHKRLNDIIPKDILELKIELTAKISKKTGRKLAPKTIDDMLNLVHTVYQHFNRYADIEIKSPASVMKVERYNPDNARQRYLTKDEIKKLFCLIRNRNFLTPNKNVKQSVTEDLLMFTKLSLSTGARLSSVLTIRVKDIDFNLGVVDIANHKSKRRYKGYLNNQLLEEVKEWTRGLPSEFYLIGRKDIALARSTINRRLKIVLDRGFNENVTDRRERVVVHTFRHTFGSQLAIQGTPLYTIMKLLDHTSIEQTMVYAKLAPLQGREEVQKFDFI